MNSKEKNAEVPDVEPLFQVGDALIHPGGIVTVPVILHFKNNANVRGFQAKVILPEGLEFVKDGNMYTVLGDDYSSGYQITSNAVGATLSILGFGIKPDNVFKEGALCYFKVKAATDFKRGEIDIAEAFITFDSQEIACYTQPGVMNLEIPAASISLNINRATLKATETVQLEATVLPATTTDKTVIWSSSDETIASVDANGLVTANKEGTAEIIAKAGTKEASITITVIPTIAESISLNCTTLVLKVAGAFQLTASFTPATTTDKTVIWKSSDSSIVNVNVDGEVTGVALGECDITATTADGSNKEASCYITVEATPAESISIEPKGPFILRIGETIQFSATVLPQDATDKSVSWVSQTAGVSIDEKGLATAVCPAENNWICATNSVGQADYVYITVIPASVVWSQKFECKPQDRIELTAGNENDFTISYRSIRPNGGFQQGVIENIDGKWYATFPTEGAYVLEAYLTNYPDVRTKKVFNVINSDELMYIDGIYYQYTDSNKNAVKVVRGYEMYSGDYVIPSIVKDCPVQYIDNEAFAQCKELGGIIISEGVTEIRNGSFENGSISAIDIPASMNTIDAWSFNALDKIDDHYSLMSISLRGLIPIEVDSYIFNGYIDYDLCELHVPEGTASLYASAEVWKDFKNIIDDLPGIVNVDSVVIDQEKEVTLVSGETRQLTAAVYPDNATDKSIEWLSEDPEIVSVAPTGLISAIKPGWTRVFAKAANNAMDSISINVIPTLPVSVETITIDRAKVLIDGMTITVDGLVSGTPVRLIDMDGRARNFKYSGEPVQITVAQSGIYILSLGKYSLKIAVI